MVSPALPYPRIPHAGGSYVWRLSQELQALGDVTILCPDSPSNRRAEETGTAFSSHVVIRSKTSLQTGLARMARHLQDLLYRIDPGAPDLAFSSLLFLEPSTRRLLRGADVIDLQWSAYTRLWPILRLLNHRARLIGTFHDVDSQRLRREADAKPDRLRQVRWRIGAMIAARWETSAARHLSRAIVFSDKDRDLLAEVSRRHGESRISVVAPPLGTPDLPERRPAGIPTVIMVAFFARAVNVQAAQWLLSAVWPRVIQAVPAARLRLVGADPDGALTSSIDQADNVTVTGFVDDLWQEYAQATVAVVPLLSGAGVKFKTIEALLAGTPVVATPVGAEGIAGEEKLTAVTNDPTAFTDAIIRVLLDPATAADKASAARTWAEQTYGIERFRSTVRNLYGEGAT